MILKKRQLVTAALVMALGAAVFINRFYTKPRAQTAPVDASVTQAAENLGDAQYVISSKAEASDTFAEARLKREQSQAEAMEVLQEVLKDTAASQAATAEASKALADLTNRITLEADIETLIEAKTGLKSLVILGTDSAEILLSDSVSEGAVMLQISEIACAKTALSAEKVTIIESKTGS